MASAETNPNIGIERQEPKAPTGSIELLRDMEAFKTGHEQFIAHHPDAENVNTIRARMEHVIELMKVLKERPDFSKTVGQQYDAMLKNKSFTGTEPMGDSEVSGEMEVPSKPDDVAQAS